MKAVSIMEQTVRLLRRHGFADLRVPLYLLPELITSGDIPTDFDCRERIAGWRGDGWRRA
jgi:hypothetical protein